MVLKCCGTRRSIRLVWEAFSDPPTVRGLALLGVAVIRLDRTSSRLAIVNLGMTLMIFFLGITQVVLRWRGNGK
jgi:hypothetical protein